MPVAGRSCARYSAMHRVARLLRRLHVWPPRGISNDGATHRRIGIPRRLNCRLAREQRLAACVTPIVEGLALVGGRHTNIIVLGRSKSRRVASSPIGPSGSMP